MKEMWIAGEQYIRNEYSFKGQIRRSSVSIVSNIAEGFKRYNNMEFNKFLGYAKGSAGELKAPIIIAYDIHYISMDTKTHIENECDILLRMIDKLRRYLSKNN